VSWDAFFGVDSPESVQEPYPYRGFYDGARYSVNDALLTLRYFSYPADAAVQTVQAYMRAN
jgi:hypothetical protein